MKGWAIVLGGFVAWTAHFFAVYAIASILPGTEAATWLVLVATVLALAATGWLMAYCVGLLRREGRHSLDRWIGVLGALGCALALVAIAYQGLPALIG